jgi:hypothetical protein
MERTLCSSGGDGTSLQRALAGGALFLALLQFSQVAQAQGTNVYDLSWFVVAGGGGKSTGTDTTGAVYTVSGTLGQWNARTASGSNYTVVSGFWGVVAAIQTEGAPLLTVNRAGGSVVVKWPFPSTGFVLQQTTVAVSPPAATLWTDVTSPTGVHVGSDWTVTIPAPPGNRFFRLRKP